MLLAGVSEVGEGRQISMVQVGHGEDTGGPQGEDNHPQNGAHGCGQLSEAGQKVKEALKIPLGGTQYFTDSSAVLGMLRTESGRFTEFVGARVSEVKVNSNIEEEWLWLVGNCNLEDLGTRSIATPQDMGPGLEYQDSMAWMKEPMETWPFKKSFSPAPEEQFRKDMMEGAYNTVRGVKELPEGEVCFPTISKGGLGILIRLYGYVVAAIYKWRKKTGARGPVIINPIKGRVRKIGYLTAECRRAGKLYLTRVGPEGNGDIRSKNAGHERSDRRGHAQAKEEAHHGGFEDQEPDRWDIRERGATHVTMDTPAGNTVYPDAHEKCHEGVLTMLHRSRKSAWIIHGQHLAEAIKTSSTEFRPKEKRCMEQRMGPLSQSGTEPHLPVRSHGFVWAHRIPGRREQKASRERMGSDIRLHGCMWSS